MAAFFLTLSTRTPEPIIISAIAVGLVFLPEIIERRYQIQLPVAYDFTIVVFIYSSLIMGSLVDFYHRFWWWDALLHTTSGVVLGFVGFLVLYIMYYRGRLKASLVLISFLSFCFGLALGALWEIYEFAVDSLAGTDLQPSLNDTMWDLIVDSVGAGISSLLGYQFLKTGRKRGFFAQTLASFIAANPKIRPKT